LSFFFWPLCFLSFFDLWLWLPLWYLLAIVFSILLWSIDSEYRFGIFWPLCCLSFFDLRTLITPLVSFLFLQSIAKHYIQYTTNAVFMTEKKLKSNQMEFSEVRVSQFICIVVCISLFVILSFLFWPLYWCLQTFEKNVYGIQQMSTASVA
jgi:hypothetical protein